MSDSAVNKAAGILKGDENSNLFKFYKKFTEVINCTHETFKDCTTSSTHRDSNKCKIGENIKNGLSDKLKEFNPTVTNNCKHCDYFIYGIYAITEVCKSDRFCISWLYSNFDVFWKELSFCTKKENNGCNKNFVRAFDNVLKNKLELYNFLEYYSIIRDKMKGENSEKDLYCTYVEYIFDIYHSMMNEDYKREFQNYANELKLFQELFHGNSHLLELKVTCDSPNLSRKLNIEKEKKELLSQENNKIFRPVIVDISKYVKSTPDKMSEILKNTLSYNLYDEFNTEVSENKYDKDCENFKNLGDIYKDESEIICKKIARNIEEFGTFKSKIYGEERCLHYKNWVYYKIWSMIKSKSKSNYDDAKKVIIQFMELQKDIVKKRQNTVCRYHFTFEDFIELHLKKEEKDLYEYFKYYNTIESTIPPEEEEKDKYKKYLDYINDLYRRRKNDWECCDKSYGVEPSCRHYFNCGEEYNPSNLIAILNGANKDSIKEKYNKKTVTLFGDEKAPNGTDEKDIMRIQYGRCTKLYDPTKPEEVMGLRSINIDDKCDYYKIIEEKKALYEYFEKECPPPKNNCPDFYNKYMPYNPDNALSKLPCHEKIACERADAEASERRSPMQHTSGSEQDNVVGTLGPHVLGLGTRSETEVTSDTSPIGTKVGQSILGITPVLLTASALYRYTPIGSWIRNLGKNSTNSISDMDREMEGFFGDTQESGDILLGEAPNYISYQPM
ncbi:PIR Superfamily Protein [Plasmodium ovale wallikeri]|uniref:PIR Superfamily Protein n=1 Tax=Plasmodium ovale wallikeri TaxID=864142 RepID=A0A1A9ATF6_PLAOA|nr:PIR Superfamily Protein [Plasmodium ovale wallikeri]